MICGGGPPLYALDAVIRMHVVAPLSRAVSPGTSVKPRPIALIEIYPRSRLQLRAIFLICSH